MNVQNNQCVLYIFIILVSLNHRDTYSIENSILKNFLIFDRKMIFLYENESR